MSFGRGRTCRSEGKADYNRTSSMESRNRFLETELVALHKEHAKLQSNCARLIEKDHQNVGFWDLAGHELLIEGPDLQNSHRSKS